jgi:AraC-like DNA-binding protein/quercetin dioxygenase-like cupin family protein
MRRFWTVVRAGRYPLTCQLVPDSRQSVAGARMRLLARGDRVEWHAHDRDHVVYPAVGVISVLTAQASWVVPSPSRAVFVPARIPHAHRAHSKTVLHTILLPERRRHLLGTAPTVCSVSPLLRELLAVLAQAPPTQPHQRARLFAVVDDLLGTDVTPSLVLPRPRDPRLIHVAERLEADPAAEHSLLTLAAAAGSSPRTLTRLIEGELGLTLPQWRTQLRLAHSLLLLADGQPVTTTAHRCGWRSASSYIAAFRAVFDTTPAAYRRSVTTR